MTTLDQSNSDEQLAAQAQAGCSASFEALVSRYEARIYRFIASGCGNAADAQELTQDVFVAAFRGLERFDPRRSFATWLFTIARRKCIDHYRSPRLHGEGAAIEEIEANDPGAVLAQREAEQGIWHRARAVLSAAQFEVLWLRHAEELEVREVAQVTGRTQTHVKVLLFRARLRLERELARPETPDEWPASSGPVTAGAARRFSSQVRIGLVTTQRVKGVA